MDMQKTSPVPHLTTALTGPLLDLERHLIDHQNGIETWLRRQWLDTPAPFYTSVDLRNAGFKLAPVDTNLFPAGFNNLNPGFITLCIQAIQSAIERVCPTARRVMVIPESHTRNTFYLESLATLLEILDKAGFEARIGSLIAELTEPRLFELPSGRSLLLEPVERRGDRLWVDDFSPCLVLLNNDLAGGRPAILEGLEQDVAPPLGLGWGDRLKSAHFEHYTTVAGEFAELVEIDPWLITPRSRNCGEINFMLREGEDCLAHNVNVVLNSIRAKYEEYGLDKEPFVVVKADAGTYGMGIMTVRSAEEIRSLNRKQRTRMAASKGGKDVRKVLIQEGVYTFETWGQDEAVA